MNVDLENIYLIHLASTLFMTGLIWFVQIVHYPLFNKISNNNFIEYEKYHMNKTSLVVIPIMLVEIISGIYLLYRNNNSAFFLINLGLLLVIWLSTALVQGPYHNKLVKGFNNKIHSKLVNTNWIRTILWSFRSLLLLSYL